MKINFSKIAAAFLAGVMAFGSMGVSAQEAYQPVDGEDSSINKYLVVKSDAEVPNVTFNFAIEPAEGKAAADGKMAILAPTAANGVVGTPTIQSLTFAPTDEKTTAADAGVTLAAGEQYVKKTAAISFDGVTFSEPGIYRYKITESSNFSAIQMDTQAQTPGSKVRYLDVYVSENNGVLDVSTNVLHELDSDVDANATNGSVGGALADKSVGFVNKFLSYNLEVGKEVTGNQGAKDKYFNFTVDFTNLQPNKTYNVDISNASASSASNAATAEAYRNQANATSFTSDADGKATVNYYLSDGEYIQFKGLPVGVTYEAMEDSEDYKQTFGIAADIAKNNVAHQDGYRCRMLTPGKPVCIPGGTITDKDEYTGYTNTREGVIPTGVATAAGLGVGLAGLALVGALASRKKEDED